jgi:hypothetical protein
MSTIEMPGWRRPSTPSPSRETEHHPGVIAGLDPAISQADRFWLSDFGPNPESSPKGKREY